MLRIAMDLSQTPLQTLLQDFPDQLPTFVDKLRHRAAVAETETERHAVLQALFPVVKALLVEEQGEERPFLLDEVVLPAAIPCLYQYTSSPIETVKLVIDNLSELAVVEFHTFGIPILHLVLATILLTLENELDFAEVEPIIFIEKHLPSDRQTWDSLQNYMDSTEEALLEKPLNLEACLDLLGKILKRLKEVPTVNKDDQEEIEGLVDLSFVVIVSLMSCTDKGLRGKVINSVIPEFFRWEGSLREGKRSWWCKNIWDRSCQIYSLPATNLLRSEVYEIFARLFDYYFGLDKLTTEKSGTVSMDLRYQEKFWEIIQSGLKSDDSLARKYTVFVLKRAIEYSAKHASEADQSQWTKYFEWRADISLASSELWEDFFVLYDAIHENLAHLVDPILPRLNLLLRKPIESDPIPYLHSSWWALILYRGFRNEQMSVRKHILEYVLSIDKLEALNVLGSEHDFFFGALLTTVDVVGLFIVPTLGSMVSPFGELFRRFVERVVTALENEAKAKFLCQIVHHIAFVTASQIPILYIIEALASLPPTPVWSSGELKSLRNLVDRHRNFQKRKDRILLKKYSTFCLINLADTKRLSYEDISSTISSLINENPLDQAAVQYNLLAEWVDTSFDGITWLENNLERSIYEYTHKRSEEGTPYEIIKIHADRIARIAMFFEKQPSTLQRIFTPIFNNMEVDNASNASYSKSVIMFGSLFNEGNEVKQVSLEPANLGVSPELAGILINYCERHMLEIKNSEDIDIDEKWIQSLVMITSRLLRSNNVIESTQLEDILARLHKRCFEQLHLLNSTENFSVHTALSKCNHLLILKIIYDVAVVRVSSALQVHPTLVQNITELELRKPTNIVQKVSWGEISAKFVDRKWKCFQAMAEYSEIGNFDMMAIFERCLNDLEKASEQCAESVLRSLKILLSLDWPKDVDLVSKCIDNALLIVDENQRSSKYFPGLISAFISMTFQPALLCSPDLNNSDGPMKKVFSYILEIGDTKPFVVAQCSTNCYTFWRQYTMESLSSVRQYVKQITQLLVFGPLRDMDAQKMDSAVAIKLDVDAIDVETIGTAEHDFTQRDYLTRVQMNDLLLHLDPDNPEQAAIASEILSELIEMTKLSTLTNRYIFLNQAEHRIKLRIWCAILLLSRFINTSTVDDKILQLFDALKRESMASIRVYIEWILMRLFIIFPEKISFLYKEIDDVEQEAHTHISVINILVPLGDVLPPSCLETYFSQVFRHIIPWLTSNHFTIRLYAQWAFFRNWASCEKRTPSVIQKRMPSHILHNDYLQSLYKFLQINPDCVKFRKNIIKNYYLCDFDPLADFNIEFIFRQLPSLYGFAENERIAARSFEKVNPISLQTCSFRNPSRILSYTSIDQIELLNENMEPVESANNEKDYPNSEDVYQKKFMPWDIMLWSDIDLSRDLIQRQRKRNDIIVIASLIDRIPNLAGLCRTCEIFNAALLAVHSLKIKDDIGFTSVSVSSEKWIPMIELREPEIPAFLTQKKEEGYAICGLEQTTNSISLSNFEFPSKCVLILGKETHGIPAQILRVLDHIIEIEQFGLSRSLNVHVSGALCIYEYTKQIVKKQHAKKLGH